MKAFAKFLTIAGWLSVTATALYSLHSSAQSVTTVTNGYICAPKNIGGEETRLYFRQQDGVAENLSPTATFPVVCPVLIPADNPPYEVLIRADNASDVSQKFACALEEHDESGTKVRSYGQSVILSAHSADDIFWQDIYLLANNHYLSLRCILPPRGGIGIVAWY